jgi:hypothetical protein
MARSNGAVIFEGPSVLDGAPIVVVVTGLTESSENDKTGAMLQTWILRADMHPSEALVNGADASICGACPHRRQPDGKRTCYVRMQAPPSVWKAYVRGSYPRVTDGAAISVLGMGRKVRLGSYGDPAAVPFHVWASLVSLADGNTGYTHQLAHPAFDTRLLLLCMVSADSAAELRHAESIGARAFHVRPVGAPLPSKVAQCPAAAEAGKRTVCAACMLCGGSSVKARSISIEAHGASRKGVK